MNLPVSISASEIQKLASSGSPALINVVGRAFGLAESERTALSKGNVPGWFWATVGMMGGLILGIQIYKRWPEKVPWFLGGSMHPDSE